jgi:hypothetical protein
LFAACLSLPENTARDFTRRGETHAMAPTSFTFCMHGLTDREGKVVQMFLDRAQALGQQLGRPIDIDEEGVEILADLIDEMLPKYTIDQATRFVLLVLDQMDTVLELSRHDAEGSA